MWVKNITDFGRFLLSKHSLSENKYYFNLNEFLKRRIHALAGKLQNSVSVGFRRPYLYPCKGHKHGVSIQSFINLGKTFPEYLAYEILHRPDSCVPE